MQLIAGGEGEEPIDVGEVRVTNNDHIIDATYMIDVDYWEHVEAHADIQTDPDLIPQRED